MPSRNRESARARTELGQRRYLETVYFEVGHGGQEHTNGTIVEVFTLGTLLGTNFCT